jgi:hypothetical protein
MITWIASHKFLDWLMTAATVLAIVLPVRAIGHKAMWPVSISTLVVVGVMAALVPRVPHLRSWYRHHQRGSN